MSEAYEQEDQTSNTVPPATEANSDPPSPINPEVRRSMNQFIEDLLLYMWESYIGYNGNRQLNEGSRNGMETQSTEIVPHSRYLTEKTHEEDVEEIDKLCVVCYVECKTVTFCNHRLCESCVVNVERKCPICRESLQLCNTDD
jgi:hypothetical protein